MFKVNLNKGNILSDTDLIFTLNLTISFYKCSEVSKGLNRYFRLKSYH